MSKKSATKSKPVAKSVPKSKIDKGAPASDVVTPAKSPAEMKGSQEVLP